MRTKNLIALTLFAALLPVARAQQLSVPERVAALTASIADSKASLRQY